MCHKIGSYKFYCIKIQLLCLYCYVVYLFFFIAGRDLLLIKMQYNMLFWIAIKTKRKCFFAFRIRAIVPNYQILRSLTYSFSWVLTNDRIGSPTGSLLGRRHCLRGTYCEWKRITGKGFGKCLAPYRILCVEFTSFCEILLFNIC